MKKIKSIFLPAIVAGVATLLVSSLASADNVFISNNGGDSISEITGSNMPTTIIDTGLDSPTGVAIYGNDLYVANNGTSMDAGYIQEYSLATDLPVGSPIVSNLVGPRGITFDSAGNLYVADQGNGTVIEIPTGTTNEEILATGLNAPNGVVDYNGVLYATLGGSSQIVTIADGSANPLVTSGLNSPNGIAIDGGNLFVVSHLSNQVLAFTTSGGALGSAVAAPYQSSLSGPKTIAVDSMGDFYVEDNGDETVTEYSSTGVLLQVYSTNSDGNPAFNGSGFIVTQAVVPEPTTYVLMLTGLALLYFRNRRKLATLPLNS